MSGPDGYCYDPDGICTQEKLDYMLEMRASGRNRAQDYADKFGVKFVPRQEVLGSQGLTSCMPSAISERRSVCRKLSRSLPTAPSTTSKSPICPPPTKLWSFLMGQRHLDRCSLQGRQRRRRGHLRLWK
ncbi:MAG: hypothetical protein ACLSCQ_06800 [Evtepia gabavorous]